MIARIAMHKTDNPPVMYNTVRAVAYDCVCVHQSVCRVSVCVWVCVCCANVCVHARV